MSEASIHANCIKDVSARFHERYRRGEWRDTIFRDLILHDIPNDLPAPVLLDIGCGRGFDGDFAIQRSIASVAAKFIGIEPDRSIDIPDHFTETHRSPFESAPIATNSVDVAYAIMVLEHLEDPRKFFDTLHAALVDGGVFWALTVDERHWFCTCSKVLDFLHLKEIYLRLLLGRRGEQRYENYPVFYRCNSPVAVARYAAKFSRIQSFNFSRVGQCDACFPRPLRPVLAALDRRAIRLNAPGTLLAVRLQK